VDAAAAALIDSASAAVGTPILVGAQEYPATGGRINLSLLWQHGQGVIGSYAKQRPVPFGEYIPNRDFFRRLYPDVDRISTDMFAGTEPAALDVPIARLERDVTVGPIICFEVGIDQVIHGSIKNGAEILFVQTNNASFGPTNESIQQLAMSRLRAIETGRAVVHVSTVGVSAIYTPTGAELERTGHFSAEQMMQELVLRDSRTPAVFLGEIPVWISWAGSVLLLVTGLFSRNRREVS
jgi:apolipoprotein N-acyltransferase